MSRMNATQKANLNGMCFSAQGVLLGDRIDALEFGAAPTPAAGTLSPLSALKYSVTPANGSAVATKAALALTASAQTGIIAGVTQPDFPRCLSVKGNASGITGNVVIHGTNFADAVISDTIALNGASEVFGVKAFKTITGIDYPAETHAGTDTVSIGRANLTGFPIAIPDASVVIAKTFDGAADAGTVTPSATVEGSYYAQAGTFNGTKVLSLTFLG